MLGYVGVVGLWRGWFDRGWAWLLHVCGGSARLLVQGRFVAVSIVFGRWWGSR